MTTDGIVNVALTTTGATVIALTVDPMTVAAATVMVIGGIGAMLVQVFNAWAGAKERVIAAAERKTLLERTDAVAKQADIVAEKTEGITQKAVLTDQKIDSIKSTTEEAAKNVDGNLTKVRDELTKQTAHSQALQATVDSLVEIIKGDREVPIQTPAPALTHIAEDMKETAVNTKETAANTKRTEEKVTALEEKPRP